MANYTIVRPADREAWLEERKKGIGSSEVGIIAGVSHFETPIGLWRRKMGLTLPTPESSVMAAGHEFEPVVAQMYAQRSGDVMDPASEGDWLAVDNDSPFLRVSPDRIFWDRNIPAAARNYANGYIVECKTTSMSATAENYPRSWFFQVQYQMGVMGIKRAVIACISTSPVLHFFYVEVPFNAGVFAEIKRMLSEFWNVNVLGQRMPEVVLTNDDASHMWPEAYRETVSVADEDLLNAVRRYNELNARHSETEKEMDDIKLRVKTYMQQTEELCNADGKVIVTWKNSKVADTFDKERFAQEHPDLYGQYMKTGQTCRRITFRKSA